LKRLEQPVVFARYEGEGHWWGMFRAPNRIDYWQRVVDWFDGHLRIDFAPPARRPEEK
jgi:dipeptidyl aminopeptidase/acylaminoacyl peptidase